MKIKNISKSPYGARTKTGVVTVDPGQIYDGEFEPAELANIKANTAVFQTGSDVSPDAPTVSAQVDKIAGLTKQVDDLTAENKTLTGERDDAVKSAADLTKERDDLAAKLAKFDADGNGSAGGSKAKAADDKSGDKK